jgi:predicted SAM-dependent methyltransferase
LIAAVKNLPHLETHALVRGKRVLHFAPEKVISSFFKNESSKYLTADLYRENVDFALDMCDMTGVSDNSYDLIIACDVLEHVPDDSAALREISRILSMQGWAILTVPQKDNLTTKYEDQSITTPEGRRAAYGQEDHLRIYGDDFDTFLENHNFDVIVVDENDFDSELIQKHVLFPPILSEHPLATNHRRIYFAQKRAE